MKKRFFIIIILALLGMTQSEAQTTKVALLHEGNITLYGADQLQDALDASVDGDTLFLNEGTFTGSIKIYKKVSLIGAGKSSFIKGDISIYAEGDLTSRLLDGLSINGAIQTNKAVANLNIRKCSFTAFIPKAVINNAVIERCKQYSAGKYYFCVNAFVKGLRVLNTKIFTLSGSPVSVDDAVFVNCGIEGFAESTTVTFINSVVRNGGADHYAQNSIYSYCYIAANEGDINNRQNCQVGSFYIFNDSPDMLGSDGTPVGIYGGTTPFTLEPSIPVVTDYDVKVNTTTKKLNVSITVESK